MMRPVSTLAIDRAAHEARGAEPGGNVERGVGEIAYLVVLRPDMRFREDGYRAALLVVPYDCILEIHEGAAGAGHRHHPEEAQQGAQEGDGYGIRAGYDVDLARHGEHGVEQGIREAAGVVSEYEIALALVLERVQDLGVVDPAHGGKRPYHYGDHRHQRVVNHGLEEAVEDVFGLVLEAFGRRFAVDARIGKVVAAFVEPVVVPMLWHGPRLRF